MYVVLTLVSLNWPLGVGECRIPFKITYIRRSTQESIFRWHGSQGVSLLFTNGFYSLSHILNIVGTLHNSCSRLGINRYFTCLQNQDSGLQKVSFGSNFHSNSCKLLMQESKQNQSLFCMAPSCTILSCCQRLSVCSTGFFLTKIQKTQ